MVVVNQNIKFLAFLNLN